MSKRAVVCGLVSVFLGCAHASPSGAAPCVASVEGADEVLRPGATVVLGEIHGTKEIPEQFGMLVCQAASRGPVLVGLEQPAGAAPTAYLQSDGGSSARAALLADDFWKEAYQDGRRSLAMLDLLERLRALKAQGRAVEVVLFDAQPTDPEQRDAQMAEHVLAARAAHPGAITLLLTGNLHARKTPGHPFTGDKGYRWLSGRLGSVTTLDAKAPPGSAWVCHSAGADSCGPDLWGGGGREVARPAVVLRPSKDGAYDGVLALPSMTASPPAAFPDVIAHFDERLAELRTGPRALEAEGLAQYGRKDFAGCAASFGRIAKPSADQLYSRACCQALAGQRDEAFGTLGAALAAGFDDQKTLQSDPDLASLRGDSRWATLRRP